MRDELLLVHSAASTSATTITHPGWIERSVGDVTRADEHDQTSIGSSTQATGFLKLLTG